MEAVKAVTAEMWPGVPVVPVTSAGASDEKYLRAAGIPVYGTSGMFHDVEDIRAHGRDERIAVRSLYEGQVYLYRLVKRLASPRDSLRPKANRGDSAMAAPKADSLRPHEPQGDSAVAAPDSSEVSTSPPGVTGSSRRPRSAPPDSAAPARPDSSRGRAGGPKPEGS